MTLRAAVVMDYQNVHMTGREVFGMKSFPAHESLIHPGQFARQVVARRNSTQLTEATRVHLGQVDVFRGLPDAEFDSKANGRNMAQKHKWEQDPCVRVVHRPLKYEFQVDADGRRVKDIHGKLIPTGFKEEKGIDVLCALSLVRNSLSGLFDVVILASADSDLTPALDEAVRQSTVKVETCSWFDRNQRRTWGSHKTEHRIWNTRLDSVNFDRSLDRNGYE